MKYCKLCGRELGDDARFCDGCGAQQPLPDTLRQPAAQPRQAAEGWAQSNAQPWEQAQPAQPWEQPYQNDFSAQAEADETEEVRLFDDEPAARPRRRRGRAAYRQEDEPEPEEDDMEEAPDLPSGKGRGGIIALLALGALLIAFALWYFLPGLGTANSRYIGAWTAQSGMFSGYEYQAGEMLTGPLTITLNGGGKAVVQVNGTYTEQARWRETGEGVRLSGSKLFKELKLADGALTGEYAATGVILTLTR